ncbi:MAG: hypothetical protein H3C34_04220 [Caldilineaceae bacterium]|nr:hypothetical protein [Caldilineaceae bacterium]
MDRAALIARKNEVRRQIERLRRRLEQELAVVEEKRNRRRIGQLERQLEQLMAEEYNLRLRIDQADNR